MKVKFANRIYEVLFTKKLAGLTMYAVEDEPNHIDWLINVEVVDDEKKELKKISQRMISAEAKEAMYGKPTAWSEEDEVMLDKVIKRLHKHSAGDKEYLDIYYWLIALKDRVQPQKQWKPSDEQIMCLQDALSDYHRRGYKAETLETLLEQLKQL